MKRHGYGWMCLKMSQTFSYKNDITSLYMKTNTFVGCGGFYLVNNEDIIPNEFNNGRKRSYGRLKLLPLVSQHDMIMYCGTGYQTAFLVHVEKRKN